MEENQKSFKEKWSRFCHKVNDICDIIFSWFKNLLDHHGLLLFAIFLSLCALGIRYAVFK